MEGLATRGGKALTVRLDADLWHLVETEASRAGISVSRWVREALLDRIPQERADAEEPSTSDTRTQASALRSQSEQANRQSRSVIARARAMMEANLATRHATVLRAAPDFKEISQLDGRGMQTLISWLEKHVHPDDRELVSAAIDGAVRDKAIVDLKHRFLRADGTTGWTVIRAVPLVGMSGQIEEWLVVSGDGTRTDPESGPIRSQSARRSGAT